MENKPLNLAAMKKTLILIIMPLLLLGKTQAQEQDTLLIDQPLRHHAVTIDPVLSSASMSHPSPVTGSMTSHKAILAREFSISQQIPMVRQRL